MFLAFSWLCSLQTRKAGQDCNFSFSSLFPVQTCLVKYPRCCEQQCTATKVSLMPCNIQFASHSQVADDHPLGEAASNL